MNNCNVKVLHFSGARIKDTSQFMQTVIKKKPEFVILHIGPNYATTNDSKKILEDVLLLKSAILKSLLDCRVIVSKRTFQSDDTKAALTLRNLNKHIFNLVIKCVENDKQTSW